MKDHVVLLEQSVLEKLSTGRLLNVLRGVSAQISYMYHNSFTEREIRPYESYHLKIKELLNTREHLDKKPKRKKK